MTGEALADALDGIVAGQMVLLSLEGETARARILGLHAISDPAFLTVARFLAAAAYEPGGVTLLGRHWCAAGPGCPEAPALTTRR